MVIEGFSDLAGYGVVLRALRLEDEVGLAAAARDGEIWTLPYAGPPAPPEDARFFASFFHDAGRHVYVVCDTDGQVLGTTSFYRVEADIRRLLIGFTWLRQSMWRTAVNTSCKLLMLEYAFEVWGANVVAWETDILNTRSQAAIERLGAQKDGVLRGHRMRRDGSVRDTVAYSMTAAEWPTAKERLLARLAKYGG